MITDENDNFGYIKKEKPQMKDFIKPSENYKNQVLLISNNINRELTIIENDFKAFKSATKEIFDKVNEGMFNRQIQESYRLEKEKANMIEIEDDILDIFSKKLKSLKQNLQTDGEF